jgi:hypothetical protein
MLVVASVEGVDAGAAGIGFDRQRGRHDPAGISIGCSRYKNNSL